MTNEKLKETLTNSITPAEAQDSKKDDVVLTDSDLDEIAGGCAAMCGTMNLAAAE
ncbi:hypothetical protein NX784_18450 [Massilia pinisoli]|uniref:Uncharacterized protein n=1 Tax=Massilia pinisoli TaxID=1772194 RepID=A0ABT1ZUR5_9BURK|nr:hypothetical protein [Massilia pinisoli]MCS0583576.1 hypothetical protein [Massilia pinisoli]